MVTMAWLMLTISIKNNVITKNDDKNRNSANAADATYATSNTTNSDDNETYDISIPLTPIPSNLMSDYYSVDANPYHAKIVEHSSN